MKGGENLNLKPFDDSETVRPRWMNRNEVVRGTLNSLEELEGDGLADIEGIKLILPAMLCLQIKSQIGKQVYILHLDKQDYSLKTEVS